jgi:hypothetical protein
MTGEGKEWLRKLCEYEIKTSWINEPIDFEVEFEVREETAEQRSRRCWKLKEEKEVK